MKTLTNTSANQVLKAYSAGEASPELAFALLKQIYYCNMRRISKAEYHDESARACHKISVLDKAAIKAVRRMRVALESEQS